MSFAKVKKISTKDIRWAKDPILGAALLNAEVDSNGRQINKMAMYRVGQHKVTKKIAIIPTGVIVKE